MPPSESRTQWLSSRCCLQHDGDVRVVVIGGAPLLHMAVGDRVHERLAAAVIAESGAARVRAVLTAFGMDDATLWRARKRLQDGGVAALLPAKRGPRGPRKVRPAVGRRMVELRRSGVSEQRIADRLGVSRFSVRRVLKREGVGADTEARPAELWLPGEGEGAEGMLAVPVRPGEEAGGLPAEPRAEAVPAPAGAPEPEAGAEGVAAPDEEAAGPARLPDAVSAAALVEGPRARTAELAWLDAMLGLTRDGESAIVFESRRAVPLAGVLLAVPALMATGLLEAARATYGRLRHAVYGLRATILVLFACALVRRPRPEALKGTDPTALGDVLGLLRAPEVKTVRRKLREIAQVGKAHALLRALAARWLRPRDDVLGVLYVDGHVRVYHGTRKLPKAHVAQKNLCVPATTDVWVNDVEGEPVFVVTAPANAAMTTMLPDLLAELEALGGGRTGTAVFDRGGWSPKLFAQLIGRGWHILTYRKGKRRKHPRRGFAEQRLRIEGREVRYTLSERPVRLRNGLRLREIAELRDDGDQTIFVTSHFEHAGVLLAYRMFERWRQENYFRYMKENFALDALVDYGVEADDPRREVPNPARKRLDKTFREAQAELAELERTYGAAAADNAEAERRTMRGFKIAHGKVGQALRAARARVVTLKEQRDTTPKRVPIGQVLGPAQVVRLTLERKLFTDAIKAAAYRAESMLLRLLRPHFKRADDEGRAFLRAAMQLPADLVVEGDQLRVRFAPMSAPRFTSALRALCDELNALAPHFPETTYRLRYEVAESPEAA